MWKKYRGVQLIVMVIFVIGFVIPAFQILGDLLINPSIYHERKTNMQQEYDNINPPPNAKKINETVNSKITRIWISTDYSVEMGTQDIEKYYQEELKEKGWTFDKVDNNGSLLFVKKECIFVITSLDYNKVHTSMHYKGDGPNL
jgi:hypothetical protein